MTRHHNRTLKALEPGYASISTSSAAVGFDPAQLQALQEIIDRQQAARAAMGAVPIGPAERNACEYAAEMCEGLILLDGIRNVPALSFQLMIAHAIALEYASV